MAKNEDRDDEDNDPRDDEDNDPREDVLGRFMSQKQIKATAAALPLGSRTLAAAGGSIAQHVNSLIISAKANALRHMQIRINHITQIIMRPIIEQ